jgi:hypothetical protein
MNLYTIHHVKNYTILYGPTTYSGRSIAIVEVNLDVKLHKSCMFLSDEAVLVPRRRPTYTGTIAGSQESGSTEFGSKQNFE